ncbi:hypothetical protein BOX15_Mlig006378g1, partial [Macrostomum lignano]
TVVREFLLHKFSVLVPLFIKQSSASRADRIRSAKIQYTIVLYSYIGFCSIRYRPYSSIMLLSASVVLSLIIIFIIDRTLRSRRLQSARSSHGFTSAVFQPLKQAYESCCKDFESASRGGSALAVFHHGQLVADIWSGVADPSTSDEWHHRTEANAYSCSSRLLAGVCLARLSAQGYLDYSKPVADYWPELSASNNSAITVLQLLSQSEGLGESISAHAGSAHGRQSQNDVKATLGTWDYMLMVWCSELTRKAGNWQTTSARRSLSRMVCTSALEPRCSRWEPRAARIDVRSRWPGPPGTGRCCGAASPGPSSGQACDIS